MVARPSSAPPGRGHRVSTDARASPGERPGSLGLAFNTGDTLVFSVLVGLEVVFRMFLGRFSSV